MATVETKIGGIEPGHIGLNVTNLGRSVEFYRQVFGFDLLQQSQAKGSGFAFLGEGGDVVLTLWQQSDGKFEKRRSGLHHLSFQVSSLAEVQRAEERVKQAGGRLVYEGPAAHQEGAQSGGLFFEDPDGIRLEIYAPSGLQAYAAPVPDAPTCGFF